MKEFWRGENWVVTECDKCREPWVYDNRERYGINRPLCTDCEKENKSNNEQDAALVRNNRAQSEIAEYYGVHVGDARIPEWESANRKETTNKELDELLKKAHYKDNMKSPTLGYAGETRPTPETKKEAHMDESQIGPVRDPASYYIDEAGDTVYYGQLYAKSDGLWPAYTHQGYYRRGFQEGFRAGQEAGLKLANDIMNCCAGPSVIVDYKALRALSGMPLPEKP